MTTSDFIRAQDKSFQEAKKEQRFCKEHKVEKHLNPNKNNARRTIICGARH